MKTKILLGLVAVILLAGIVVAIGDVYRSPYPYSGSSIYTDVYRTGPHRISDIYDVRILGDYKIDTYVYLNPLNEEDMYKASRSPGLWTRGYPHFAPRGTAEILSYRNRYTKRSQVHISTKDIEPSWF